MVSMPLCCCSLRSLGVCCTSATSVRVENDGAGATDCCHAGSHDSDIAARTDSHPCVPGDDGKPCRCGKSLTKLGLLAKPAIELPEMAFDTVLPPCDARPIDESPTLCARAPSGRLVTPPPTSLLRLHCALTV